MLKNHGHGFVAQFAEFFWLGVGYVFHLAAVQDGDFAAADFVEAVDGAQHGGFAGAGEAHEDENLALLDVQVHIGRADDDTLLGDDVAAGLAGIQRV